MKYMSKEEIEALGWKFEEHFNNREIYELGIGRIFEHNGEVGICYHGEFIYGNLSLDELVIYTSMIKAINEIENAPDKHSYLEALHAYKNELNFVAKLKDRD